MRITITVSSVLSTGLIPGLRMCVIKFFPPFLTKMENPEDTQEMVHEIMTVGVSMAVLILVVWVGMVVVSEIAERRKAVYNV